MGNCAGQKKTSNVVKHEHAVNLQQANPMRGDRTVVDEEVQFRENHSQVQHPVEVRAEAHDNFQVHHPNQSAISDSNSQQPHYLGMGDHQHLLQDDFKQLSSDQTEFQNQNHDFTMDEDVDQLDPNKTMNFCNQGLKVLRERNENDVDRERVKQLQMCNLSEYDDDGIENYALFFSRPDPKVVE